MQRTLAHVKGGRLYEPGRERTPIDVGTAAWFDWLEQNSAFTFVDSASIFSVYKSPLHSNDSSWEASSTRAGQRSSVWLGPSYTLTLERLQGAAHTLATSLAPRELPQVVQAEQSEYGTPRIAAQLSLASTLPQTKLVRPRLPSDVIPRPHLLERLNAGLDGPLTLLHAQAGYGKSTLLAQWLATLPRSVAWLSLDEHDDELAVFLHGLIASLQRAVPDSCQASANLLRAPRLPPLQQVAVLLSNDLADMPEDVLVVLDDYHLIQKSEIHTLLTQLVEYLPQHIHLVLASRTEPPLPLARWRARGQMHDLQPADLRFTPQETHTFLAKMVGDEVARESVNALVERTEGWAAVLRLASLSLRGTADTAAFIDRLDQALDRNLSEYLTEEVLAQLPPDTQEVLVRMSLPEQFNAELGAAILGNGVTASWLQGLLDELERSNLFVVPWESRQEWYRLHHLIKQVLEQRLQARISPEELAALHRRASAWYAVQGLVDEALQHALAAGDMSGAARLVEAQVVPAYEQEQWKQLERWMHLLSEEQIQSSPFLLVARVWISQYQGQLKEHPRWLTAAERLVATSDSREDDPAHRLLQALIAIEWCRFHLQEAQPQAGLASIRAALEWMPPDRAYYIRAYAIESLALSNQLSGHEVAAVAALQQALQGYSTHLNGTARLLTAQSLVYLPAGKLPQLEHTAQLLLRISQQTDLALSRFFAHWSLGLVAYEWNDLDAAIYHFTAVIASPHLAPQWVGQDAMCMLALTYQAQGLSNRAQETTRALLAWLHEQHYMARLTTAYAFCGRLALIQGEVEAAQQWLDLTGEQAVGGAMMFSEDPPITQARLLLARGDEASVTQGHALLSRLVQHTEATYNTRKAISVLALQAWAYEIQGRRHEALAVLERALTQAHPGGFIRTFADLPGLAPVFGELRKRRKAGRVVDERLGAYLQRILAAMTPTSAKAMSMDELMRHEGLEPLTERELHILHLLDRNLTNKEIAHELVVTPGTVKVHTNNLYRKLSVDNRRAAVTLAKALGLLAGDQNQEL